MRRAIYIVSFIILAQASLNAQVARPNEKVKCMPFSVECPTEIIEAGMPITFKVNLSDADAKANLTFKWDVSSGTIISGQGTNVITVDTTGLNCLSLTATLTLGGLAPNCPSQASCTLSHVGYCGHPRTKFDEYGNISFEDEQARLDNFAIELKNWPEAQGYIFAFGGRRSRVGEAAAHLKRIQDYLTNRLGFAPDRFMIKDGGYREDFTVELHIGPRGVDWLQPSPTVSPDEVEFISTKPKRKVSRRKH